MAYDLMLDIETLGKEPNTVILSLGAIIFDPYDSKKPITKTLYLHPDVDEQFAIGRSYDESTIQWWSTQPKEIQEEAFGNNDRVDVETFLNQLNKFMVGAERYWAQGPTFDMVILENLYGQLNRPIPWQFWKIRDSRTFLGSFEPFIKVERLEAHNAIADCIYQAQRVQAAVQLLRQSGLNNGVKL